MSIADLNAKLKELYQGMEAGLAERVRVFEDAELPTIRREAHKLRGGFPHQKELTRLATRVEELAAKGDEGVARAVSALVQEAQRISQETANPPRAVAQGAVAPCRIHVVDDDSAIRQLVVLSLERLGGHTLTSSDSATEVLGHALEGLYDLIIVDAMMPGVSGVNLALRLREQTPDIAVVVMSAAAPEELGAEEHGLTWWRKPITPQELVRRVAALMGPRRI